MVVAKMAAPDSTSILQRWTLLHEAAQCRGVLGGTKEKHDCSPPDRLGSFTSDQQWEKMLQNQLITTQAEIR